MAMTILLVSDFGNNIFTRSSISGFFDKLNSLKSNDIKLDFKGVEFISRSCADEYLKKKRTSLKKIVEVNMSEDVCEMFRNVEIQYKNAGIEFSFSVCSSKDGIVYA